MKFFSWFHHQPQGFGLDISDDALHLVETRGTSAPKVTSSTRLEIPSGLIEAGRILDQAKLAEVLQRAYRTAQPQPPHTSYVVSAIPESQTYSVHVSLDTSIRPADMRAAAVQKAQEQLPIDMSQYVWDYQILTSTDTTHDLLFAAAPQELVASYVQTYHLADLKLGVLELESQALTRALLAPVSIGHDTAVCILDIGHRSCNIILVDQYGLQLSVLIPYAGRAFTEAIVDATRVSFVEAEKRKRAKGFEDAKQATALRLVLAPLIEELQKAIGHYERKALLKVKRIFVTGGSSALPGLPAELEAVGDMTIELGRPICSVKEKDSSHMGVACGLALRAYNLSTGINFIQPT